MEVLLAHAALFDIRCGDEQLCHGVVILGEELVVNVHQLALADSGGGLLRRHVFRPFAQVELAKAHGDGAGGDEDDLVSHIFKVA